MAIVTFQKAGETVAWDPDEVRAFLVARGVALGPGGVACGVDAVHAPFVAIDAPAGYDPTADLNAFTPTPNPKRAALAWLVPRIQAIRAKPPAARLPAENDLLALVVLIKSEL